MFNRSHIISQSDYDGRKDYGKNAQRDKAHGLLSRPFPFFEIYSPGIAYDYDKRHMESPAAEIIFSHFTTSHSIKEKLKIPGDPGYDAKKIVHGKRRFGIRIITIRFILQV
jgi:hypothetical protein